MELSIPLWFLRNMHYFDFQTQVGHIETMLFDEEYCYDFKALAPKQAKRLPFPISPYPSNPFRYHPILLTPSDKHPIFASYSCITLSLHFISDLSTSDSLSIGTLYR